MDFTLSHAVIPSFVGLSSQPIPLITYPAEFNILSSITPTEKVIMIEITSEIMIFVLTNNAIYIQNIK